MAELWEIEGFEFHTYELFPEIYFRKEDERYHPDSKKIHWGILLRELSGLLAHPDQNRKYQLIAS